jgi:hypothetical protein
MIIVKLIGGLGNQMFQYATGRYLAHLHNTGLKLDTSFLNTDTKGAHTKREFELDVFNLKPVFATEQEITPFIKKSANKVLRTIGRKLPFVFDRVYIAESGNAYHKEFMSYPKETYLDGFWQSEKYFLPIRDMLLTDLAFKNQPEGLNKELLDKMASVNSVSIHVRRTDYVNNPTVNNFHGTCSLEYYQKAVEMISEKQGPVELFIFSDDINWCKENLKFAHPLTYISHNTGKKSYEDMRLMSHCKHNIIANSSFSWWGAWLNTHTGKTIIAPVRWYNSEDVFWADIYPADCVVI